MAVYRQSIMRNSRGSHFKGMVLISTGVLFQDVSLGQGGVF